MDQDGFQQVKQRKKNTRRNIFRSIDENMRGEVAGQHTEERTPRHYKLRNADERKKTVRTTAGVATQKKPTSYLPTNKAQVSEGLGPGEIYTERGGETAKAAAPSENAKGEAGKLIPPEVANVAMELKTATSELEKTIAPGAATTTTLEKTTTPRGAMVATLGKFATAVALVKTIAPKVAALEKNTTSSDATATTLEKTTTEATMGKTTTAGVAMAAGLKGITTPNAALRDIKRVASTTLEVATKICHSTYVARPLSTGAMKGKKSPKKSKGDGHTPELETPLEASIALRAEEETPVPQPACTDKGPKREGIFKAQGKRPMEKFAGKKMAMGEMASTNGALNSANDIEEGELMEVETRCAVEYGRDEEDNYEARANTPGRGDAQWKAS